MKKTALTLYIIFISIHTSTALTNLKFHNFSSVQDTVIETTPEANSNSVSVFEDEVITFKISRVFLYKNPKASYTWHFENNNIKQGTNIEHSYSKKGHYTVKLIVNLKNKTTRIETIKVHVNSNTKLSKNRSLKKTNIVGKIRVNNTQDQETTLSAEDLVKNVLINSNCANISWIETKDNGNTSASFKSWGYFNRAQTTFPFEEGVILTTGSAREAVPGSLNQSGNNNDENDTNFPNWDDVNGSDVDLKKILNDNYGGDSEVFDTTSFNFKFTPLTDQVTFRFIFASEEYEQSEQCENQFRDGFAFLVKGPGIDNTSNTDFGGTNIANVPESNNVVVSSVSIAQSDLKCDGLINGVNHFPELYTSNWGNNNYKGEIEYNGHTIPLQATIKVIPNEEYTMKIVIGDRGDHQFNSAVFLEAGSFDLGVDLGEDITVSSPEAMCEGESYILDATINSESYTWFKQDVSDDFQEIMGANAQTLEVFENGTYKVRVNYSSGCFEEDDIVIEFKTIDDASFTITPTCQGAKVTSTASNNGSYMIDEDTANGATVNTNTGEITGGTPGNTITITRLTPGTNTTCADSFTTQVTLITQTDSDFTITPTCDGGTVTPITTGGMYSFSMPPPTDGAIIDSETGTITQAQPDTEYTIIYTLDENTDCESSTTKSFKTIAKDDASFLIKTTTCNGGTMEVTGLTDGTFNIAPNNDGVQINTITGEVTQAMLNTTYTITYSTENATNSLCPNTSQQQLIIPSADDASFTVTPNCEGGTIAITGLDGGFFKFSIPQTDNAEINTITGEVTNASPGVTYSIEYNTETSPNSVCPNIEIQNLTVLPQGNPDFTFTGICNGATAEITGTTDGQFSFVTPVPTDGATLDRNNGTISNGVPGTTYEVVYFINSDCAPNSEKQQITIPFPDDSSFTISPTCDGGIINLTGKPGGTFSFVNKAENDPATIDNNGVITMATPSTNYEIKYLTNGACPQESIVAFTVLDPDNSSFSITTQTCDGGTVTLDENAVSGGTYRFKTPPSDGAEINANTGTVTNGSLETDYIIIYSTDNAPNAICATETERTLTTLPLDNASFFMTPTCDGGTATITGYTGGQFTFDSFAGTAQIDSNTGEVTQGVSGQTITIKYETTTCINSSTVEFTILETDNPEFELTATCDGATAEITGTEGGTFSFAMPEPTDGAQLNALTGTVTNAVPETEYTIIYTTAGKCPNLSEQSFKVADPDDPSFTMLPTCDGGTATVTGLEGGRFSFATPPTDNATINSETGTVSGASSGGSFIIQYTTTGNCPQSSDFILRVHPEPDFNLNDIYALCVNTNGSETQIETVIDTQLNPADYNFEWKLNDTVLASETNSSLTVNQTGIYSVLVKNKNTNCSKTEQTEVKESAPPVLEIEVTKAFSDSNAITITATSTAGSDNISSYEFKLDNNQWLSNTPNNNMFSFNNIKGGTHTITVRDINGCGEVTETIQIIDYPLYFTPNNDGINDTWNIIDDGQNSNATIFIYDRLGKLLKQLNPLGTGWDGTYNGKNLPATDYWFIVIYNDPNAEMPSNRNIFKSHFSLKR